MVATIYLEQKSVEVSDSLGGIKNEAYSKN